MKRILLSPIKQPDPRPALSDMLNRGVAPIRVAAVSGNKHMAMLDVYGHTHGEELHEAVAVLSNLTGGVTVATLKSANRETIG